MMSFFATNNERRNTAVLQSLRPRIIRVMSPLHLLVPAGFDERTDMNIITRHPDQRPTLTQPVLRQLLLILDGIQSLSALEVKVKYGAVRAVFIRSAREKHLLRCSVVCDVTEGKVHVKLHTPFLVSMATPLGMVRSALETVNRILNQLIPVGDSGLTSLLSVHILRSIIFGKNIDNELKSDDPNVEESIKISALMDALCCLNITIKLTRDIRVTLRRKERFCKKSNVELEARNGMQSFKEPRNRFQRKKVAESTAKLYEWIRITRGRSVTCQIFELISHLDYYCEDENRREELGPRGLRNYGSIC